MAPRHIPDMRARTATWLAKGAAAVLLLAPLPSLADEEIDAFVRGMTNGLLTSCRAQCAADDAACEESCTCVAETLPTKLDVSVIAAVPQEERTRETAMAFMQANQPQIVATIQECGVVQGDG